MIEELTRLQDIVLATGGGAVLNPQNRDNLHGNGTVIYLRTNINELWQRTRNDKHRPLLQTPDPRARLEELFKIRDPLYLETAHIVIDTGGRSVNAIVHQLEEALTKHANAHR